MFVLLSPFHLKEYQKTRRIRKGKSKLISRKETDNDMAKTKKGEKKQVHKTLQRQLKTNHTNGTFSWSEQIC